MTDTSAVVTPPTIAGKLLWVHPTREAPRDVQGFLIEFPELETRLGEVFLRGRQLRLYNYQWVGYRHIAIAWSAVVKYVVFESREHYISCLHEWSRLRSAASR